MCGHARYHDAECPTDHHVQNLRSAEEMEEEEREAQSAKLQELIRRGTPSDLQEANRLMKVMAGFDNRHKTDYRAKAAEEVAKVQQKAKLLEEMLQGLKPGDKVDEGDVFEVLLTESSCCAGQRKKGHSPVLSLSRNLQAHYRALTRRSRGCVKKNLKIRKPSTNF